MNVEKKIKESVYRRYFQENYGYYGFTSCKYHNIGYDYTLTSMNGDSIYAELETTPRHYITHCHHFWEDFKKVSLLIVGESETPKRKKLFKRFNLLPPNIMYINQDHFNRWAKDTNSEKRVAIKIGEGINKWKNLKQ